MDGHIRHGDGFRLTASPRRSPQINLGLSSPVRSVHPETLITSMHTLANRTPTSASFFHDSDDDVIEYPETDGSAQNVDLVERQRPMGTKDHASAVEPVVCHNDAPKSVPLDSARAAEYQPLTPSVAGEQHVRYADTPTPSYDGSIEELLLNRHYSDSPQPPDPGTGQAQLSQQKRQTSAAIASSDVHPTPKRVSKVDHILAPYAIAHELTLRALMRAEEAVDQGVQALHPVYTGDRASLLPLALRAAQDPRSPRNTTLSPQQVTVPKKAHVAPPPPPPLPPIDVSAARTLNQTTVRTPYPFEGRYRRELAKDLGESPASTSQHSESVLTLSIRRSNANSRPRITTITLPASNDFSATRSSHDEKEHQLRALEVDDEVLFNRLRRAYTSLSGHWRFVSARSLKRIVVSGTASRAEHGSHGLLAQPRSPRALAHRGLSDTFGEDKIMQHFLRPAAGRSRYAFVQWAHRLAATPTPSGGDEAEEETLDRDLLRRLEQPEGLEFVVGWSARRILGVLAAVLAISVAAALLWIFLGLSTPSSYPSAGGFLNAGDRVAAGVLTGICVLLLGLSALAGWIGLSWLVM